jgi:hypothetical protein
MIVDRSAFIHLYPVPQKFPQTPLVMITRFEGYLEKAKKEREDDERRWKPMEIPSSPGSTLT